jgi:predicted nucleotidyltransferase
MSKIPTPNEVELGLSPTIEQLQTFAQQLIIQLNSAEFFGNHGQFVLYGSLARQDATRRSDIDLAFVPYSLKFNPLALSISYEKLYYRSEDGCTRLIKRLLKMSGCPIEATVMFCSSRRLDIKQTCPDDPYATNDFEMSPTTYDHFGFLMRDPQFDEQTRTYYASIQREIAKYSRTGFESRLRDLRVYVQTALHETKQFLNDYPEILYEINCDENRMEKAGKIENYPYHILRKMGGIAKNLGGSDAKNHLHQCFTNPNLPFFGKLMQYFDEVLQFNLDMNQMVIDCLCQPEKRVLYHTFLQTRLKPMAQAILQFLQAVDQQLDQPSFIDQITERPIKILIDKSLARSLYRYHQKYKACAAIEWIYSKKNILMAICGAYHDTGDKRHGFLRMSRSYSSYPIKTRSGLVSVQGRVEIDFSCDPPQVCDIGCNGNDQELARKVHAIALAKIKELLVSYRPVSMEKPFLPRPRSYTIFSDEI